MQQALLWAAAGTGFTFSMTALGAAMVFFMKKQSTALMQRIFLGFAAGVMIAASVWSLLIPAIEETEQAGGVGWLPASGGFLLGILLMLLLDGLLPHLHNGAARAEGLPSSFRRTIFPKEWPSACRLHAPHSTAAAGDWSRRPVRSRSASAYRTSQKGPPLHCRCIRKA